MCVCARKRFRAAVFATSESQTLVRWELKLAADSCACAERASWLRARPKTRTCGHFVRARTATVDAMFSFSSLARARATRLRATAAAASLACSVCLPLAWRALARKPAARVSERALVGAARRLRAARPPPRACDLHTISLARLHCAPGGKAQRALVRATRSPSSA